jgi:RNA polymerase sigma-70 factor (ECF subfamily)
MGDPDDRALLARIQAGDDRAFTALVEAWTPRLLRWLTATGCPHHDAEDVVQETFLRVHRHAEAYRPRWAVSTWLFTIAHRIRLDLPRRSTETVPELAAPVAPDPVGGGLWELARDLLGPEGHHLLWLRYGEDLEPGAIAGILGISGLACRVRLHRARARLRTALADRGDPVECLP